MFLATSEVSKRAGSQCDTLDNVLASLGSVMTQKADQSKDDTVIALACHGVRADKVSGGGGIAITVRSQRLSNATISLTNATVTENVIGGGEHLLHTSSCPQMNTKTTIVISKCTTQ